MRKWPQPHTPKADSQISSSDIDSGRIKLKKEMKEFRKCVLQIYLALLILSILLPCKTEIFSSKPNETKQKKIAETAETQNLEETRYNWTYKNNEL